MWLPDISDGTAAVVTAASLQSTVDYIAEIQLPNGMVPWFPGGHADPWNHNEALMALSLGGRRAEAERGFEWLRSKQRPDGSWHQYYLADRVEQDKLDANCVAYVAAAVWHHWLLFEDRGFLEVMWPTVTAAIDFVLDLQTPRGEIIWARHADGTPWSFALLTGSSSMCHSLRCAIAVATTLGHSRPDWELSAGRLARVIREEPDAFAPKHRWAMDWYYPVLCGVIVGDEGRARLAERFDAFVMEGKGVRCVSDRPWVTAAETCEAMMAHLAVGEVERAHRLFEWAQTLREPDGRYWTGIVYPEEVHFPGGEQSTYTAAAVVLGADALAGASPASSLFVNHDELPALIDTHTDHEAGISRERSE
ncbi:MAG: prenyltransferase [Microthrixaceae bacterium]|nr:prenyltransferase [Microthrixaceae bacterium]